MSNLHVIREHTYRQIVPTLRTIADEIEAGDYGAVGELAVVLMGDRTYVFGAGPASDATSAAVLLQAGAFKLIQAIANHGEGP